MNATPHDKAPLFKLRILVAAANPNGALRAVETEIRTIKDEIGPAPARDGIGIEALPAARWRDLSKAIVKERYEIVHFAGHNGQADGLYFDDGHDGPPLPVSGAALCALLGAIPGPPFHLVFINACATDSLAEPLLEVAEHVIAMRGAISDFGANTFAAGVYRAIASRHGVPVAFRIGISELLARAPHDHEFPMLRSRSTASCEPPITPRLPSPEPVQDPILIILQTVRSQRNLFLDLPRDLADELSQAFPFVAQIVDIVSDAEVAIEQASRTPGSIVAGHRLRLGQIPLDGGAGWAWRCIVRDAAAIAPTALMAVLLMARSRRPNLSIVNTAIARVAAST